MTSKKYKNSKIPNSYKVVIAGKLGKLLINGKVVRTGDIKSIQSLREYMVRHNLTYPPLGM
jgi:hypothetical protein